MQTRYERITIVNFNIICHQITKKMLKLIKVVIIVNSLFMTEFNHFKVERFRLIKEKEKCLFIVY